MERLRNCLRSLENPRSLDQRRILEVKLEVPSEMPLDTKSMCFSSDPAIY